VVAGGDGVKCVRLLETQQSTVTEAPPRPFAAGGQWRPPLDSQKVKADTDLGTEGLAE
jgi:hypothetical protein